MKRILYISLLTCLLAACTKQVPAPKEDFSREGFTLLTADIEALRLGEGQARKWVEGDAIGLFGSEQGKNERYLLREADRGLANGTFYGPLVKGSSAAAYFPWERSFSGSAEGLSAQLSADQHYDAAKGPEQQFLTYCPTAFAFLTDGTFKFRYPFGMLEVLINLEDQLTILSVSLTDNAQPLAGQAVVSADGVSLAEGAWNTLSLDCGEGVSIRDGSALRPFYLVLPAGNRSNLTLQLSIKGETEPMNVQLKELNIPRIETTRFTIGSVIVQSTGPASFEPINVTFDE